MPLRSEVLTKRWSTANLPILPFLAPRVFQPWPSSGGRSRRTQSSTEAKRTSLKNDASHYDTQPRLPRLLQEAPDTIVGSREQRGWINRDDGAARHASWGDGLPTSSQDAAGNTQGTEGSVTIAWKSIRLQDSIGSIPTERPAGLGDQLQGDGFVPTGSVQGREFGSEPAEKYVSILPKSPAMSLASEKEAFRGLVNCRPTTITNHKKNAKDSFFYWRNVFGQLMVSTKSFPTGKLGQRRNIDSKLKTRGFVRSHLHQLYQDDIQQLWNDLVQSDQKDFEKLWNGLTEKSRVRLWPGLMITALQHHPDYAFKLLAITYTDVLPPDYAVSDTLDYLISRCLSEQRDVTAAVGAVTAKNAYELQSVVAKWMRLHHRVRISQKSVHTLTSVLEGEQLRQFYEVLRETKQYLFPHTSIQIASRLAKTDFEHVELSFDILKSLNGRINFDHPAVMSLCTTILHRSQQIPDSKSTVAEKFQAMLELGMKVNIIIYNVLIQNAIRSGDPETAWKIHRMMVENDTEPDDYTYSILLNDAKWRMDSAAIRSVMGYLREKNIGGPHIHTDLLHLILLLHQNEEQSSENESEFSQRSRRKEAFDKMLGKYCEKFHLEPLGNLIPNFSRDFPHASNSASSILVDPPAPTLAVMLTGILYSLDSAATKELYDRFIRLIGRQDPFALIAASNVYVWNVFLMSLGRFHERVNDCPKVIKAMITLREEAKEKLARPTLKDGNPDRQDLVSAEPDVFTWSILLQIFTKHNQLRAAEKVITAMQSRGTPPNEVTWTTLAFGYSRMQDVEKMADTINRMEKGGLEVVDGTVTAMAGINDREGLARALNRRKAQPKTEMDGATAEGFGLTNV